MAAALGHVRQAGARAWAAYEGQLRARPLATQATTSALLWAGGDLLAQRIERSEARADARGRAAAAAAVSAAASARKNKAGGKPKAAAPAAAAAQEGEAAATDAAGDGPAAYDLGRAALTALFGGVMVGPVGHVWYANLDRVVLGLRSAAGIGGRGGAAAAATAPAAAAAAAVTTAPGFVAAKVLLDTIVMGPFYVAGYFTFGAVVMDGGGWREARAKLAQDFWQTLAAEVCIWPAVQGVNFLRTPVHHQLLVVNSLTVVDAAFMSWARAQDDWVGALRERLAGRGEAAGGGGGGAGRALAAVLSGHRPESGGRWRALPDSLPPPPKPHRKPKAVAPPAAA